MWLEDDIDSALAWIAYEGSLCSGCRRPTSETMNPDNDGAYEAVPVTCFACGSRHAAEREARDARSNGSHSDAAFDGLYFAIQHHDT